MRISPKKDEVRLHFGCTFALKSVEFKCNTHNVEATYLFIEMHIIEENLIKLYILIYIDYYTNFFSGIFNQSYSYYKM